MPKVLNKSHSNYSDEMIAEEIYNASIPFPDSLWEMVNLCIENGQKRGYINDIYDYKGKLVYRTFAFKSNKKMPIQIREVCRRVEGQRPCLANIDFVGMAGYVVDWGMCIYFEEDKYKWKTARKNAWFQGPWLFDVEEIIEKYAKHCAWEMAWHYFNFFEYLEIYRSCPSVEYLIKAGYGNFVRSRNLLNSHGKTFEQIFKVDNKWANYLKTHGRIELIIIRNYNVKNEEEVNRIADIYRCYKNLIKFIDKKNPMLFVDYFEKNKLIVRSLYADYIGFVETLGYPKTKQILYPSDLHRMHDQLAREVEKNKNLNMTKLIKKRYDQLKKYNFHENTLMIRPFASQEELIEESKSLEHCIRTYVDKYANGKTDLFCIRKIDEPDHPYVSVEVMNNTVKQARGYKNNVYNPLDPIVTEFLAHWKREFNFR